MTSVPHDPAPPLRRGVIGELFWVIPDPVLVVNDDLVEAINPAGKRLFGFRVDLEGETGTLEDICGDCAEGLRAMIEAGRGGRLEFTSGDGLLHLDVKIERVAPGSDRCIVLLRDVTTEQRYVNGLVRLNEIAREVSGQRSLDTVLQRIVDEAKAVTGAAFSALLILKQGSETEVAKFVYNAPRHLFPSRLPRAVGLLAVPIRTRKIANLEDIRGHPAGVGIPVDHHPPIGPLLAVPIIADDQVFGEVAVANAPGDPVFEQLDEHLLTELGHHAAEAVRLSTARSSSAKSEKARQTLVDVIRHDMATPVAVARGCIDHLGNAAESLSEEQRSEIFRALDRAIAALERLSANLRSDARLENPTVDQQFDEIAVDELIDELRDDLVDYGEQRHVQVLFHKDEEVPAAFRGIRLLIRQAIENLVTNAVKHSTRGTQVVVTCRAEGDGVRFDVRDEGTGISAHLQEELFDRFTATKSGPGNVIGLGIGLSIVRRVADLHGGTVGVTSQPDHGSTFWITLPVEPSPEAPARL